MKTKEHLLIIRLSAMGDVAMTVPALLAFVKKYPEVRITFVSKPFLKPIFDDIPNIDFYAADVKGTHKGIIGLFKLFSELRKKNITAVADLHNVLRSKILRFLFAFSFKKIAFIDKGRKEKKALTRTANKKFIQLKTTHERYADVFRSLGYNIDLSSKHLLTKKELANAVKQITGDKSEQWIGIAPFAQYTSKMYPLEQMKKVIHALCEQQFLKIFLFGGGSKETKLLEEMADTNDKVFNMAGKIQLDDELCLISNLDAMISMDSGNAHFAANYGIPTYTIWGITHPYAGFAPFGQPQSNAILPDLKKYPNIPCSIYGNKVCPGYENVMDTISPETVVSKIKNVLNQ